MEINDFRQEHQNIGIGVVMKNFFLLAGFLLVFLFLTMTGAQAHPGPVDSDGCHLDSEGRRHCH